MFASSAYSIRVVNESVDSDVKDHKSLSENYSLVCQLDASDDRYQELLEEFFAKWSKPNTTGLMVEAILKVMPSRVQKDRYLTYKRLVSSSLDPAVLNEKLVCRQGSCATCGIIATGFDVTRSGNGSLERGQAKRWQRFGHGVYFSPHTSKCHFYSKTGVTDRHPNTQRRYSSMVVSNVILGREYTALGTSGEQAWKAPPEGYHSVKGAEGHAGINFEENVVYIPDACLPSEIIVYSFVQTTEFALA
ncbi:hypothetical protein BGZ83_004838 [Gryganskiella cystojenkinii]|nr:hypothetical protein BGZ83_004838 [Gryganskiella cystojenkinii]